MFISRNVFFNNRFASVVQDSEIQLHCSLTNMLDMRNRQIENDSVFSLVHNAVFSFCSFTFKREVALHFG